MHIRSSIEEGARVAISILDVQGKERVAYLPKEIKEGDIQTESFSLEKLPAGMYFMKISLGGKTHHASFIKN